MLPPIGVVVVACAMWIAALFPARPAAFIVPPVPVPFPVPSAPKTAPVPAPVAPRVPPDVLELHQRAIVIDTHADTTQRIVYQGASFVDGIPGGHLDLAKMRAGGLDAQFLSIFIFPKRTPASAFFSESLHQVKVIHEMVADSDDRLALARTAREVRANAARHVPSILLGVEGGHALGPGSDAVQLAHLRRLAREGVRYMTLTWSISNPIGGSSSDEGKDRGLTDFGRRVIDEMEKLGVLVDLSHVSDPLFWDAIRYVHRPVILSHSSSRAMTDVPRNVTDAMLRAVALNGGAICVNYNPSFVDADFHRAQAPIWARYKEFPVDEAWRRIREDSAHLTPVPLARVVDHLMHMIEVAGIDHVCLGSDFDGIPVAPAGLSDASQLPALTAELRRRGLAPDQVEKILGANTLRVMEATDPR